jgi:hypothetical protein
MPKQSRSIALALRELHGELDEAREFNDLGRVEELSRELEF